jgi:anti-sigma regulatory factor (Ser/Thr protein kinase)
MSTTRSYSAGDRGPEPEGAAMTAAVPDAGLSGDGAGSPVGPDLSNGAAAGTGSRPPVAQVRRLRLADVAGAVPRARDFVRQALHDWGWLPAAGDDERAAAEDVLLVVSELVTNACLHAGGPEELRIGSGPKLLRLEVVDCGSGSPAPRTPHRAGRPGGHGMFIVQRLCADWGVLRDGDGPGKTVWAELAAP